MLVLASNERERERDKEASGMREREREIKKHQDEKQTINLTDNHAKEEHR